MATPFVPAFDPAPYIRPPIITLASGITLAHTLVDACPKGIPANVKKSRDKLKATADEAQRVLTHRRRELGALGEDDSRIMDQEGDNSFGAFRGALRCYAMLPVTRFPKAKRAAEIDQLLFGMEGLEFLKSDYSTQSATMHAIVQQIDEDGLEKEINDIIGPDYLIQIRDVLPRYAAMVKAKLRRDDALEHNLSDHARAIQAAIANYATKVVATADEDDPETIETVHSALRPIEAFRAANARRAQGAGAPEQPAPKDQAKPDEPVEPANG